MKFSTRAEAIFRRTYCRELPDGSFETPQDVLNRTIDHQRWLWARQLGLLEAEGEYLSDAAEAELEELFDLLEARKVLPGGRPLWMGGTRISREREIAQFNCAGMFVKTVFDVVDFTWLLLNGAGVGGKAQVGCLYGFANPVKQISVIRSKRTEKGGRETNEETWDPETRTWTISIGDSGEAWAKSVGKLLAGKYPAEHIIFDFSEIRPEGSKLSRYGWRSSGDTVIADEFPRIARILSRRAGQLLRKEDLHDILTILGVIQTGRRGAIILLLDSDDEEVDGFVSFKVDCWKDPELSHRQQSNNSLMFWNQPDRAELVDLFEKIVEGGGNEPGFINAAEARRRAPWFDTANPCVEILLADKGLCNLYEVDVSKFSDLGQLLRALWIAGRANYRQTLVDLDDGILQRTWHENNENLRLCGTSVTGWVKRPDLSPHDKKQMRFAANSGANSMADELGTPHPKNVTCGKPSGTLAKVMDTTEGSHRPLGRYIFNHVEFQRTDPMLDTLRDAGYVVLNHPTKDIMRLVCFPVEHAGVDFDDYEGTPVNFESAVDQLERYRELMRYWCDQNISQTIYYDPDEVPAIVDWLVRNWDDYVGVSWAFRTDPTSTPEDFGAAYLPQQVVMRETYDEYVRTLKPIDWESVSYGAVDLSELGDDCEGGACPVR